MSKWNCRIYSFQTLYSSEKSTPKCYNVKAYYTVQQFNQLTTTTDSQYIWYFMVPPSTIIPVPPYPKRTSSGFGNLSLESSHKSFFVSWIKHSRDKVVFLIKK